MSIVLTDQQVTAYVADNIRRLLAEQKRSAYWLQKALAVSPGALYPIIRGESQPMIGFAARIADALGVEVDELLKPPETKSRKSA